MPAGKSWLGPQVAVSVVPAVVFAPHSLTARATPGAMVAAMAMEQPSAVPSNRAARETSPAPAGTRLRSWPSAATNVRETRFDIGIPLKIVPDAPCGRTGGQGPA